MTPHQVMTQLRQELHSNERLVSLLEAHAKNYADDMYRRTTGTTNHADLLRITGVAAGVEDFITSLLKTERRK